jgi:membrane protease YdiL (CAAX protease family)
MLGNLSLLLIDLSAVAKFVSLSFQAEMPEITPLIRVLALVQPSVILALAVFVGVKLAPGVGLSAPVAEAFSKSSPIRPALAPQVFPGIVGGVFGAAFIVLTGALLTRFMSLETVDRISKFGQLLPLPTRLLSGGITEELLFRWGLMSFLVWAAWRVWQKGRSKPHRIIFAGAILLSSLVFAAGHLPVALVLLPQANLSVILFVMIANSTFGVVAGYLYWKKGLESAMIAHIFCHLGLAGASYFKAYF